MSSKFLSSDSAPSLASLQDGTFNLSVASASMSDLTPGLPVKTNSDKKLVSGLIEVDEINATLLTNPLVGTLEATDFKTASVPSFNDIVDSLDRKTQNVFVVPVGSTLTQFEGLINVVDLVGDFSTTPGSVSASGTVNAPNLEATTNLTAPMATIVGTVNAGDLSTASGTFNDIVSQTASLNRKTQNVFFVPAGSTLTQFQGLIDVVDLIGDFSTTPGSVSASVINGVVHVRSDSELPTTLTANTSYIIHGTITTANTLTVSADGCSISGHDRTKDKLVYTGTGTFLTVTNVNFSLENVGITASTGKSMSATNYTTANYNRGRDKVLSLVSCEFRNCQDVWDIVGFDLCDILNCLVWYCTGTTGCTFQDTSKLQITSSEFIRWFSESSIPTPSSYSTATMIELKANGADNAGFGAVSISSCIMHPQQTQKGISVSSSSTAGFATISANAFINVGLTTGAVLDLDISAQPAYVLAANQGVVNGTAIGELKLTGNTAVTTIASQDTPVQVNGGTSFTIPSQTRRFTGANTGTLTYGAKNSTEMFVSCTVSGQMDDNKDKEVSFYVAKNGTVDPDLVGAVEFKENVIRTVSFSGTVFAEQDDIFTVWAENNQDSEEIIVSSLKLTLFSL